MKKATSIILAAAIAATCPHSFARSSQEDHGVKLSYADGRPITEGVESVNAVLRPLGTRLTVTELPASAAPLLKASETRALTATEHQQLLTQFQLNRGQLLEELRAAGREPAVNQGGFLSTSEADQAPYPMVYDMKSMTAGMRVAAQTKLGQLHVNTAEDGTPIDESMAIIAGGPWVWFFRLPDGVVAKLSIRPIEPGGPGWRLSYSGLHPHGAFLKAESGLIVAQAFGPKNFVMRYTDPGAEGAELLGKNPWINFSGKKPELKNDMEMN